MHSATKQKWLEMHGLDHFTHFYTDYGVNLQKRFFATSSRRGYGLDRQPRSPPGAPSGERFVARAENECPGRPVDEALSRFRGFPPGGEGLIGRSQRDL